MIEDFGLAPSRNPKATPEGQPAAYPRTRKIKDDKGEKVYPAFVFPHEIVKICSRAQLEELLPEYSRPMTMDPMHVSSKSGNRYLFEWIYPALRWFCRIYDVEIPKWLEQNGILHGMSRNDYRRFFGQEPLEIQEWKEDQRLAGDRE